MAKNEAKMAQQITQVTEIMKEIDPMPDSKEGPEAAQDMLSGPQEVEIKAQSP